MGRIEELLVEFNPWWSGQFALDFRPREIYKEISRFHGYNQITALTGLRRSGKSTMLMKAAQDAITGGMNPKSVMYFSFDELRDMELREVLRSYQTLSGKDISSDKKLLLLDEIQKVGDWENKVKTVYDLYKGRAKIYLSGSESLFVNRKSKETLAGRIFHFKVNPLTFREYLEFSGAKFEPVELHEKELRKECRQYTISQGFPELVGVEDAAAIQKYLQEGIVEKAIYRDLPEIFHVKESGTMESLLRLLMEQPGQIIDMQTLASQLRTTRQTISNYLYYLEQAFLVKKLYNYSTNKRKSERKLKKFYPAIMSPQLTLKQDSHTQSVVLECAVVNSLNAEYFWRDQYKNEVDIVLTEPELLPIEVKLSETKSKSLELFIEKHNTKKGYIVTQGTEDKPMGKTEAIPAYKFLLLRATKKE